ncbi:hypothetical protein PCANC_12438 [Puccinia coronata f. sp. avenae]|uniref:Uncharacterized protein n=1 Tax=Puccinia coronata f. sp. avenae TaxID=200324 RepID=A0A2N5T050_9BASI|nr:hypothetical protein PCANC_12438 [Puccinia coronata f. sp. avenae]
MRGDKATLEKRRFTSWRVLLFDPTLGPLGGAPRAGPWFQASMYRLHGHAPPLGCAIRQLSMKGNLVFDSRRACSRVTTTIQSRNTRRATRLISPLSLQRTHKRRCAQKGNASRPRAQPSLGNFRKHQQPPTAAHQQLIEPQGTAMPNAGNAPHGIIKTLDDYEKVVARIANDPEFIQPYQPDRRIIWKDEKFYPKSNFTAKKQKLLRKLSHIHIISTMWLSPRQVKELTEQFGFYRKENRYTSDETSIVLKHLESFLAENNTTKAALLEGLKSRKKVPEYFFVDIARDLLWRDWNSIKAHLKTHCYLDRKVAVPAGSHVRSIGSEDSRLLEVMRRPEYQLEPGATLPAKIWKLISLEVGAKSEDYRKIQRRWTEILRPAVLNRGHFPQFVNGDWLTLLKLLLRAKFSGSTGFKWEKVAFSPFSGIRLRREFEGTKLSYCTGAELTQGIRSEIEEFSQMGSDELNSAMQEYK